MKTVAQYYADRVRGYAEQERKARAHKMKWILDALRHGVSCTVLAKAAGTNRWQIYRWRDRKGVA